MLFRCLRVRCALPFARARPKRERKKANAQDVDLSFSPSYNTTTPAQLAAKLSVIKSLNTALSL